MTVIIDHDHWKARAEAAEAEVSRLRALVELVALDETRMMLARDDANAEIDACHAYLDGDGETNPEDALLDRIAALVKQRAAWQTRWERAVCDGEQEPRCQVE